MNKQQLNQARLKVAQSRHRLDKLVEDFGPESTVTESQILEAVNQYRQARSALNKFKKPAFFDVQAMENV